MTTVEYYTRGERREYPFPDDMPAAVWAAVVQTALNAVACEATRKKRVRQPAAYAWATIDRHVRAWRDRRAWGGWEARLVADREARSGLRSVLDLDAALQAMYLASGQACLPQLRAVTGHDVGRHPVDGPGSCSVCRAAEAGDWPAFARLTALDAVTMEHAYTGVRDAGLVTDRPRRAAPEAPRARPAAGRMTDEGWEEPL